MDFLRPNEILINDENAHLFASDHVEVDGERKTRGLVPRDFRACPVGYLGEVARPFDLPLFSDEEIEARLAIYLREKAYLSAIRDVAGPNGGPIPSRDQNGKGYCWAHSTTSAVILARAAAGMPYADLSAYAVACIIKGYRDQGGWNAESVEFAATRGIPTSQFWPQQSMSRSNDKPETWENAKKHLITEWMDLDPANMKRQMATALLCGYALATDHNWWGHSISTCDLISWKPFRTRIWNSWGDGWSANGMGVLEESKAVANAAIAVRAVKSSAN